MQNHIKSNIQKAISTLVAEGTLQLETVPEVKIEYCRDSQHGDFASNIAMVLAKQAKKSPQQIAQWIIDQIPSSDQIIKVELAGAGFINFFLASTAYRSLISEILCQKEGYGENKQGKGKKIHMEIVSANPTGPLHVGHGRLAAFDASLSNLLLAQGYKVHCEYYVNDAGRQMQILALSIWLRYLELLGETFSFPEGAYQGAYILDIAQSIKTSQSNDFYVPAGKLFEALDLRSLSEDQCLDALVVRAKTCLGEGAFEMIMQQGLHSVLEGIQWDLAEFGVTIHEWFKESELVDSGEIIQCVKKLEEAGHIYEKEGAKWFRATKFGDEKDRVVIRANGQHTYFAADIANHLNKFDRGYDVLLNTFGSDHHGYTKRIHAAVSALGKNPDHVECLLIQFAILYRGKQKVAMSTRKGLFVTLRELVQEVGKDAARFFYVMRRRDQHLDFDLELAKSRSNENPVYYIQYAHARICSVFNQLEEKQMDWSQESGLEHLQRLEIAQERALLRCLSRYQMIILMAGIRFEPQMLASYLHELANHFHSYYNACQFLVEDVDLRNVRLDLIKAVCIVIANGLKLLGVSAPKTM